MKKLLTSLFLVLLILNTSCATKRLVRAYYSEDTTIELREDECKITSVDFDTGNITENTYKFKLSVDDYGNNIAILENSIIYRYLKFGEFILIYNNNNIPIFLGNSKTSRQIECLVYPDSICSTSFLTEGNKIYSVENLLKRGNLNCVWAEGVSGYGKNEKINLTVEHVKKIFILPGYVSIDRPDLFKKNNRPKNIRIIYGEKLLKEKFNDIAEYKEINLEEEFTGNIQIEIIDVYQGSMYDDTCISSIFCYRDSVK